MPTFITKVDVSPTYVADATWEDVDVTSHVGADAGSVAGVLLQIENTLGTEYNYGVRKNGSTDTTNGDIEDAGHTFIAVGVDSSDIFEYYITNSTSASGVKVWLVGYITTDEGTFFDNAITKVPGTAATWEDWDISSDTGAETALCVFGYFRNTSSTVDCGVRKNGSTDAFQASLFAGDQRGFAMAVDGSEILEIYGPTSGFSFYITGYLTANFTSFTNGKDYSTATTASYQDVDVSADVPSGHNGIFGIFYGNASAEYKGAIRKKGATDDIYRDITDFQHVVTEIDSNRVAQQKIENAGLDFYVWGYCSAPSSGGTATILPMMSNYNHHNGGTL